MSKSRSVTVLSVAMILNLSIPQTSLAHDSTSLVSQLMHNLTHAHHFFGGLILLAVFVCGLELKRKVSKSRSEKKRKSL